MDFNPPSLSRREFCLASIVGAIGFGSSEQIMAATETTAQQAFSSSFLDVPESFGPNKVQFNKALPTDLRGTLFRNGPARMHRGDTSYHHWFDGDGMVHSFDLQENAVTHRGRMVKTDRSIAEEKAGRFLWSGFGTSFDHSETVTSADDVNVGNISVLPVGDEVLALWESGSPWRVDAKSLETLGRKVFSPETDGLPFSAHPRVDPQGRVWNFGYLSGTGKLVLYDLDPNGSINRVSVIDAPNADMVHDFAITDRHLVFVLQPLHLQEGLAPTLAFSDRLQWDDTGSVQVLVIDKQSLQIAHQFELPPFFTFHMGNAWEDGGTIRIEVATAPAFKPLMKQITQATTGRPMTDSPVQPQTAEIHLDLQKRRASIEKLPTSGADFPRFDQRFTGIPTEQLFMLGRSNDMPDAVFGFNRVTAMNRRTDSEAFFDYDANTIAEEHIFVAAPGSTQGNGWLVGTSYNWHHGRTSLSIFDAQQVQDGPIAEAVLPYTLPLGLHGQFVPA